MAKRKMVSTMQGMLPAEPSLEAVRKSFFDSGIIRASRKGAMMSRVAARDTIRPTDPRMKSAIHGSINLCDRVMTAIRMIE